MTSAESNYFALLRAALWNATVTVDGPIDWEAVIEIAGHHGNEALVCDVALRMDGANAPAPEMKARMQTAMRQNLFLQMRLKRMLVAAVQLLREHDIEPVLLKGFGLASLYPNPSLRHFGDVDIFIGVDHFHEACRLLRTLPGGYNWGEEVDVGRHYNIEFGNCPMEIHRVSADVENPRECAAYAAIERDGLVENPQRINLDGFEVAVPSKELQVFFTFYHAWHHFLTTGVGWRQVSDVAMALHAYHGQLDLDKLQRWIEAMHLTKPWQAFGWLMVEYLGLPQTEMPFFDPGCERTARKLYRRIMREGNFKRHSDFKRKNPKRRFFHRLHAFVGIFVDFFYRAPIFPGAALREMRTTLQQALAKRKTTGSIG